MENSLIILIAMICHQANKLWCEFNDDFSQVDWAEAPQWQKDSAINGVKFRLANPNVGPDAMHNNWLKEKFEQGWVFGEVKDVEAKTHPCCVPFEKLPEFQQRKDQLFSAIVDALGKDLFHFNYSKFDHESDVKADKHLRVNLDVQLQNLKQCATSRERAIAITKLQEAIMWLGMDLKRLAEPNPYPNSYNPANAEIEPTADNLKL